MAIDLVDGEAGKPHIDGGDLGDFKAGVCGAGGYVLKTGDVLAATQPSANEVTVATGSMVMPGSGRHVRVTSPETVAVTSGTQGQKRRDLIVMRATTGKKPETASLVCVRGTPVSYGEPADPALADGDLALYRVALDGAAVSKPEPVFNVLAPISELWDSVSQKVGIGPYTSAVQAYADPRYSQGLLVRTESDLGARLFVASDTYMAMYGDDGNIWQVSAVKQTPAVTSSDARITVNTCTVRGNVVYIEGGIHGDAGTYSCQLSGMPLPPGNVPMTFSRYDNGPRGFMNRNGTVFIENSRSVGAFAWALCYVAA